MRAVALDVTDDRRADRYAHRERRGRHLARGRCGIDVAAGTATTNNVTESWTVTNVGSKTVTVKGTFTYKTRRGQTRTFEESTTILCNP